VFDSQYLFLKLYPKQRGWLT